MQRGGGIHTSSLLVRACRAAGGGPSAAPLPPAAPAAPAARVGPRLLRGAAAGGPLGGAVCTRGGHLHGQGKGCLSACQPQKQAAVWLSHVLQIITSLRSLKAWVAALTPSDRNMESLPITGYISPP